VRFDNGSAPRPPSARRIQSRNVCALACALVAAPVGDDHAAMRMPLPAAMALAALLFWGQGARADQNAQDARARLEQVRGDPRRASDPAAIEALARDAEMFPAGQVQIDARMVVAIAWLERLNRPDDAIAELHKIALDPLADPVTSRFAEGQIVDALVREGHVDAGAAEAHAHADRLDPRFVAQVDRVVRRRSVRRGALAVIAVFVALASLALGRAARRGDLEPARRAFKGFAPLATLFVVYTACAGGLLAASYESGNAAPFLLLGAMALPLVLLARGWAAVGSSTAVARVLRAAVCAGAALAAAFMALDVLGLSYLSGFGL